MAPRTHHIVVPRQARYLTMGSLEGELEEVWLACHGYGQLASEFLGYLRALEDDKRLVVAPEALSRFYHEDHQRIGATWMTREDRIREMEDYVRYLDLVHDRVFEVVERSAVKLWLLGYSQGAATAVRWALRGKAAVDRLILWGSGLPPEVEDEDSLARLGAMRLTLVGGSRDRYFTEKVWASERVRLKNGDVVFEELHFEGGHRLDDETLRRLTANDA